MLSIHADQGKFFVWQEDDGISMQLAAFEFEADAEVFVRSLQAQPASIEEALQKYLRAQ